MKDKILTAATPACFFLENQSISIANLIEIGAASYKRVTDRQTVTLQFITVLFDNEVFKYELLVRILGLQLPVTIYLLMFIVHTKSNSTKYE